MNAFLKIGLPWAVSLGIVFYIGLKLGGSKHSPEQKNYSPSSLSLNPSLDPPRKEIVLSQNSNLRKTPVKVTKNTPPTPPLPPNLIRIMKGAGILERMGSYLDALRSMDTANVQDVVAAFEALPAGYGRHLEMKLLMRSWSAINPEAALHYAMTELDEKSERRFGLSEALAGWAGKDPQAALNWANQNNLGKPQGDNPFILGVIKGIAENDLNEANRMLVNLPPGNARWQSATFLAQEFAKKSTDEAVAWAKQFPNDDPHLRETILGQIGAKLARQDLKGTASWVETMNADSGNQRIIDNLLTQWVSQSPQDASAWVAELSNPDNRQYAMKQLAARWSLVDPVSTAEWLNDFPPSASLDPVVGEFVDRISARDPEGAAGWALSIVEPEARKKAIDKIMRTWKEIDPERSEAWIQENPQNP